MCFGKNKRLDLTIKPKHPVLGAGGRVCLYTVNLYPNPTAPLIPLYPKRQNPHLGPKEARSRSTAAVDRATDE
jgi:hypothetical protein